MWGVREWVNWGMDGFVLGGLLGICGKLLL